MGIIWRSVMSLLATLAALVIIVHCVEEEMEPDYRHDLRPRILDSRTPSYNQQWRALEAEPVVQPVTTDDWDNKSSEELPKRRRPGRKRKRRPRPTEDEELMPQERLAHVDERFAYPEVNLHTTEPRRRKKPDPRSTRWTDEPIDHNRPFRRRSQRRKRPMLEPWPELSEFNGYHPDGDRFEETEANEPSHSDLHNHNESDEEDSLRGRFVVKGYEDDHEILEKRGPQRGLFEREHEQFDTKFDDRDKFTKNMKEDKSLSEFSAEVTNIVHNKGVEKLRDKYKDKSSGTVNQQEKPQDKYLLVKCGDKVIGEISTLVARNNAATDTDYYVVKNTIQHEKATEKTTSACDNHLRSKNKFIIALTKCKDKIQHIEIHYFPEAHYILTEQQHVAYGLEAPLTLKDILKRSNGTSLSEILQQHNLTLADLLHGKENAVSIFKKQPTLENEKQIRKTGNDLQKVKSEMEIKLANVESEEKELDNSETKYRTDPITTTTECITTTEIVQEVQKKDDIDITTPSKPLEDKMPKLVTKRRLPPGIRKKLRMRPMLNNTYKAQLSRDLVTLNSRKYSHHRRNATKFKEWKDVIPAMPEFNTSVDSKILQELENSTAPAIIEDTTIIPEIEIILNSNDSIDLESSRGDKLDDINMDAMEVTTDSITKIPIDRNTHNTDSPKIISMARPTAISSGLRRQAFNNRLKRKRLKHKNSTTEAPEDDIMKRLLGMEGLVSSSEFIARTQEPQYIEDDSGKEPTTLQDFITTESITKTEIPKTSKFTTKITPIRSSTISQPDLIQTTEETAKIEIEEILNDTQTSAKLSQILMERNMTLSELVEHRERGSSHVHLADIFHNASREPNPPEPFLSKSLIEPISKETYPLRALLEANLHDPTAKATTIDPNMPQVSNINIPVVMDFRNNVNENAENMGIMSLFNNFTKIIDKSTLKEDSGVRPYKTTIIPVNITKPNDTNDTVRESRVLHENVDDVVSWNEIFSLMRRDQKNESHDLENAQDISPKSTFKNIRLDEDADGDGLIVLEDLQHLKDFESNIASGSDEKIEVKTYEKTEDPPHATGILDTIPSQTKSVTIATASIAGLAMILFLLTYVVFKWREQKSNVRMKRSVCDERIPTPVFENRKGHKNNSSMRSISPMLETSNIYTLNTLDSKAGKESPDYMWDTLRKPFQ